MSCSSLSRVLAIPEGVNSGTGINVCESPSTNLKTFGMNFLLVSKAMEGKVRGAGELRLRGSVA